MTERPMREVWQKLAQAVASLHVLRLALEKDGKRELAHMAGDLIDGLSQMVEILRKLERH